MLLFQRALDSNRKIVVFLALGIALLAPLAAPAQVPTGESTAFCCWGTGNAATNGLWSMTLMPANMNFNGRTVTEQDPGGGGPDTCWFIGSRFAKFEAITGGSWTVAQPPFNNNVYGYDYVGWYVTAVNYYRDNGRAPCGTTFPQRMVINNLNPPPANVAYGGNNTGNTNQLGGSFTAKTVSSTRAGITRTKDFP